MHLLFKFKKYHKLYQIEYKKKKTELNIAAKVKNCMNLKKQKYLKTQKIFCSFKNLKNKGKRDKQ